MKCRVATRRPSEECGLVTLDLCNLDLVIQMLNDFQPDLVFHFAAVHGRAGTSYETMWPEMLAVNVRRRSRRA